MENDRTLEAAQRIAGHAEFVTTPHNSQSDVSLMQSERIARELKRLLGIRETPREK